MLVSYTRDDGPELFQDGNFLELELLQEGVLWGLERLALVYRDELVKLGLNENLAIYFQSASTNVRGLACRIAGSLQAYSHREQLTRLSEDRGVVRYYREGKFYEDRVAGLAAEALRILEAG